MNSNIVSPITITSPNGRTLIVEGLEEYRYEEDGLVVFLTRDLKSGIYVANALRRYPGNRYVESPFVLADDMDMAINKVKDALDWQIHRIPVQGQETDLYLVSCEIDPSNTVFVYEESSDHPTHLRYVGHVKWMDGDRVVKLTDMVYGSSPDEVFDRAYESVQRQHYAYCGWYK